MTLKNPRKEIKLTVNNIVLREDYGVLTSDSLAKAIEQSYRREVSELLIVEGSNCEPILMVEWKWWLSENEHYELIRIECPPEEWDMLYALGVL